jgi:hypothetical protein
MDAATRNPQAALKYEVEVRQQGRIELQTPFAPGERITVFVIRHMPADDTFEDLVAAAESSLAFWDNPLDDEDWNNAETG